MFQHSSFNHPCIGTTACPTCGVAEGEVCLTRTGQKAEPHVRRVRAYRPVEPMPTQPKVAE